MAVDRQYEPKPAQEVLDAFVNALERLGREAKGENRIRSGLTPPDRPMFRGFAGTSRTPGGSRSITCCMNP